MHKSLLALSVAAGLGGGLAVAKAEEAYPSASQQAQLSVPPAASTSIGNAALQDYRANINPNVNIPTTGIYDEEDRFKGPSGRPLPGWGSVGGQGAGDNGG